MTLEGIFDGPKGGDKNQRKKSWDALSPAPPDKILQGLRRRIRYCKACAAILNELASKIVVHIPVKENEKKQVRMDLHFAYVGQIRISFKIGREPLNESEPA